MGEDGITEKVASYALEKLEVDSLGLDYTDRKVLETMILKFNGGPVGLETLAAATNEEAVTIEDVVEPFLLQLGFISRTPRGRIALPAAYKHIGAQISESALTQISIFDKVPQDE